MYISTSGGLDGVGKLPTGALGIEKNGSLLVSWPFFANAGQVLSVYFNYVTSDGSAFDDYAWAAVGDPTLTSVEYLVTARTQPSGSIIPGQGMPGVVATLTPRRFQLSVEHQYGPRSAGGRANAGELDVGTRTGFYPSTLSQ